MSSTVATDFSGIWVPLVTPFSADGSVDHPALRALATKLAPDVAGFVVCGSTGEAHGLDEAEQLAVLDSVRAAVPNARIVMGLGGPHRGRLHEQLAALRERPLAGLLVSPPYYVRPSQAAIVDYFLDLADHSACPLIAYNIPYRTGVAMEFSSFERIARHGNLLAVKDCGGSAALTLDLITRTPLQVLAGEDVNLLSTLCAGGVGAISAAAHVFPERYTALFEAVREQRLNEARELFHGLWPLIQLLFEEPNPAGVKAALAHQGLIDARCRAPMAAATPPMRERLAAKLSAMGA